MRFVADSGLWTTGPAPAPVPLTTVLEVGGAVLSWTVDDPAVEVNIVFTDLQRADWLWRIVGENGHASIVSALEVDPPAAEVAVSGVAYLPGALDTLRRLALGHWLRRWWPASTRDGIVDLNGALLDGEIAVLTASLEDFFGADGTFDSDVAELLRPHTDALNDQARHGDPRVVELVRRCVELAEDAGLAFGDSSAVATGPHREDYALAAGPGGARDRSEAIATGVGSVNWGAVPQGVFDAAEDTIDWRIESNGSSVTAVIGVALLGPGSPQGVAVRVTSEGLSGVGALDTMGGATLTLFHDGPEMVTENTAWNHDWRRTVVGIGAEVDESRQVRDRVRTFARARLSGPGADAFLAEILAAESDY